MKRPVAANASAPRVTMPHLPRQLPPPHQPIPRNRRQKRVGVGPSTAASDLLPQGACPKLGR
ncbi:MAG: hypothetical protein ACK5N0_06485 [Synechococcaceae cyanobacterium]